MLFRRLGFRIERGRVLSRWRRKDLGPASRMFAEIGSDVVIPCGVRPGFGKRGFPSPAEKHATLTVVFPDGHKVMKDISTHALPPYGTVPAEWPWDLVEMTRDEVRMAMDLVAQEARREVLRARADASERIERRRKVRLAEAAERRGRVNDLISVPCTYCQAAPGHTCKRIDGSEMVLLDSTDGTMAHPLRIVRSVMSGSADAAEIAAQFRSIPETLEEALSH